MKKALIGFLAAAAIACAPAVMAESSPAVVVDGSPIIFADQAPVIQNDRTLVPARGVFEAMDATVEWDESKRMVSVTSADNITIVRLYIDNPVMEVYKFEGSLLNLTKKDVTLEASPQIMNDRTMIPLRAIGEALGAEVNWDPAGFTADIKSGRKIMSADETLSVSLSADKDTVEAGETFDLFINVSNMALYPDMRIGGGVATVAYDKENFEFVSSVLVKGDAEIADALGASYAYHANDSAKSAFALVNFDSAADSDGKIIKYTMRSLTGKEGSFSLTNRFDTANTTYDMSVMLMKPDKKTVTLAGPELVVDQTPVVINAGK